MNLQAIAPKAGFFQGRMMLAALALIKGNFEAVENELGPKTKTSSAANYQPLLLDAPAVILRTNAGAQTLTIPPNATVAFPVGTELRAVQHSAGALTIVAGAGVTINKLATKTLVALGQNAMVRITKIDTNVWVASGDLTAA